MAAAEADRELDALVPQAAAGDQAALARIMAIIQPPLLRYTRARITGGRHPNAEDVTQEICLAVATSIPKVADAHRFFARDVANPTEDVPETEHDSFTPEQFALVSEGSNRVRLLLDSLNDKAREVITLRVFVGLSAEETAEIVGSTPGAVRVVQHRALASLRKTLEEQELQ